ncbi:DUF748 domain-containing protein [Pseudodesulfovibrio sp. zrk46]|uniref:DUF748 domain-containing protein n=1 Tax=Pseudodesulfovibrio sp. zrk46 TaxID=2725288 RepID=UPI001448D73B|nr:DUF748 domain-containing protein [Pseudodesulfovibrio sp. zrk46]QJB55247.1 DUF748 domain-containing protein [Pseudodesulfovibrio sp. zrk46]
MLTFLDKIPFGTPKLRRIGFWVLTSFIAYVLIGFFVLPPVLKSVIIDQAHKALNRETSVEEVYFNPLTLHIEVAGVKIEKLDGDGNLASLGSFTARPGIATIWKFAPVISYLHLRDLAVDVTFYGDGRYSISDLFGKPDPNKKKEKDIPAEEDIVFPFSLYGFEMTNATIVFDDRPHAKKHVISNLNLLVPFTSSFLDLRKEFTQPKFTAVVNGDPVELTGRTLPFDHSLRTEFQLGAVDVNLDQYWRYVPINSPLQLKQGRFTSDISLFFERPDAQRVQLFLGGGGKLTNLALDDPNNGTVFSLKELSFEMEKFSLGDKELVFKDVTLNTPYFKLIRNKNNSINWAGYFPETPDPERDSLPPSPQEEAAKDNAPFKVTLNEISIEKGELDWNDRAVPGGFQRTFKNFNFTGNAITTDGDTPSRIAASIGEKENLSLNGTVTLIPLKGQARLKLKDLALPTFHTYLAQGLPMTVNSGIVGCDAELHFQAVNGDFDLAVNNSTATVNNLALSKPDAKEPSFGLTELALSGAKFDLKAKDVLVDEIRINDPMLKLVKEKRGDIDLVKLFQKDKDVVAEEKVAEAEVPKWTATVNRVRMTGGAASYKDFSLNNPATLSINTLKVDVDNVSTRQGATMTYDVSTHWGGKGTLSVAGKLTADPLSTDGRLQMRGMGLRPLDGHLGEFTQLLFASGTASTDLKYKFTGGDTPKFAIQGNASLNKVQLKDNRGKGEFAGIDALTLANLRFSNEPYRLGVADIHLEGPRVVVDFDEKGNLNLRRAFGIPEPPPVSDKDKKDESQKGKAKKSTKKEEAKATESTEEAAPEPSFFDTIDIGTVTMDKGHVIYRDASVEPTYFTTISDMKLGLVDIAQTKEARPKLNFSAKIGPTPMSVTGVVNPVITPMYSDLTIAVNGMELVPLSPYTIKNLAYPIEKGRLYADVNFKTENWILTADNKFFIEQLVLGPKDKRPGAPNVPVKFGLALLQDSNGDIELNLPIRGKLNDPDFRIGGIVFKAIASLFVKALASPFSLIGSIFGGGGQDMDFVVFQPGRHQLDQAGLKKIDTTIKAMLERQKLKLEVDGVIDPDADKRGLVSVIFENKLKQQKYNSLTRKERAATTVDAVTVPPEEYEEFLFEAYKEEPDPEGIKPTTLFMTDRQPVEVMEKFILDRIVVTDDDLNELARLRAAAVKNHMITKAPALTERVYLLDRRKDKKGKTGVPMHRADLGIK